VVGLTWKPRGGERSTFDGRDSTGRKFAHASNISGAWRIYLCPWACGHPGGLSLGPFDGPAEAMTAADEHIAAHATEPPR
jgi:hypothetical protein